MTIAACYVSKEGVVMGADSTTTYYMKDGSFRHYNNAQKVFEVGEMGSTLSLTTWGMGGLPERSYRQLSGELSDSLLVIEPASVADAAARWSELFWQAYSAQLAGELAQYGALTAVGQRSSQQQADWEGLRQRLTVGFCLGGRVKQDRSPAAYELLFDPGITAAPPPIVVPRNQPRFWGMPNFMDRLLFGIDSGLYDALHRSSHWQGTRNDLDREIFPYVLHLQLELPLREAIDWIHSSLYITIKAVKFCSMPPFCGGPIEIAVVTADRRFRWVRHKGLDQALDEHSARGMT